MNWHTMPTRTRCVDAVRAGMSIRATARAHGADYATVHRWCRAEGVRSVVKAGAPRRFDAETIADARARMARGETAVAVARAIGGSHTTVGAWRRSA